MMMEPNKIKYKCRYCKYGFTRKADLEVKLCPYCGKAGLEVITHDYASKVLDEVSRIPDK